MGLPESEGGQRVEDALRAVGLLGYEDRISHHLGDGEKK
jgi:cobalt/nickel transport system ATP-binding protein